MTSPTHSSLACSRGTLPFVPERHRRQAYLLAPVGMNRVGPEHLRHFRNQLQLRTLASGQHHQAFLQAQTRLYGGEPGRRLHFKDLLQLHTVYPQVLAHLFSCRCKLPVVIPLHLAAAAPPHPFLTAVHRLFRPSLPDVRRCQISSSILRRSPSPFQVLPCSDVTSGMMVLSDVEDPDPTTTPKRSRSSFQVLPSEVADPDIATAPQRSRSPCHDSSPWESEGLDATSVPQRSSSPFQVFPSRRSPSPFVNDAGISGTIIVPGMITGDTLPDLPLPFEWRASPDLTRESTPAPIFEAGPSRQGRRAQSASPDMPQCSTSPLELGPSRHGRSASPHLRPATPREAVSTAAGAILPSTSSFTPAPVQPSLAALAARLPLARGCDLVRATAPRSFQPQLTAGMRGSGAWQIPMT